MVQNDVTVDLDVNARSPGRARAIVRTLLGADLDPDVAMLLASELVTNAVRHARQRVSFRATLRNRTVRLEVTDDGDGVPTVQDAEELACGGRGLGLLEALCTSWGVCSLVAGSPEEGKTVWCEAALLARPEEPARPAAPGARDRLRTD